MERKPIKVQKQEFTRTADVFDKERKPLQNTDDYETRKVQSKIPKQTLERIRLTEWETYTLESKCEMDSLLKTLELN